MERLSLRIERFIRSGLGEFEPLALELFAYQFERNAPYQAYCRSLNQTPENITQWQSIPAVPIRAFKSAELATFNTGHSAAIFESSGTTQQISSRHYLKTLSFYEEALKKSFQLHVGLGPETLDRRQLFILTPPPGEVPRSSLTWMFEVVKNKWGAEGSGYFVQRGQLDTPRLAFLLAKAVQKGQAVLLLGTTLAFLKLFEDLEAAGKTFTLPTGSQLLDTGGMKTQKREVTRAQFISSVQRYLGIPEMQCINEYGMCELSSQCYGVGKSSWLQGPPWMRTVVIDGDSGDPVAEGKEGLLRHFDLANVDSVLAIQTEDRGRAEAGGFHFLGRAANADLKGCSLAADSFFAQSK